MTSWVVIDSGVLLATVLPDPVSTHADAVFQHVRDHSLSVAVPALFRYELVAVIRKHVHRGTITSAEGHAALEIVLSQRVNVIMSDNMLLRGYALAERLARPTAYDAQYLAVAEFLGCPLWTADQRLVNSVAALMPSVKWVGAFTGI
jgi:predicted nucleic acid-binding protein